MKVASLETLELKVFPSLLWLRLARADATIRVTEA